MSELIPSSVLNMRSARGRRSFVAALEPKILMVSQVFMVPNAGSEAILADGHISQPAPTWPRGNNSHAPTTPTTILRC